MQKFKSKIKILLRNQISKQKQKSYQETKCQNRNKNHIKKSNIKTEIKILLEDKILNPKQKSYQEIKNQDSYKKLKFQIKIKLFVKKSKKFPIKFKFLIKIVK